MRFRAILFQDSEAGSPSLLQGQGAILKAVAEYGGRQHVDEMLLSKLGKLTWTGRTEVQNQSAGDEEDLMREELGLPWWCSG